VIWATHVLEGLAKKGLTSRAEVTDAAMRFLDGVLLRMQAHHYKQRDLMRRLEVSLG
jgi:pyruvate kinase